LVYNNIILIGFMGSGKTSVGKILARKLFKNFADVDTIIEEEQGSSVSEIFKNKGEAHFRELEQKCLDKLTKQKGQIIATGGGLPIYSKIPEQSLIINIDADFEVILQRLTKRERDKRPLLQDETRAKVLFDERIATYRELANFSVDANQAIPTFIHMIFDYILDKRVL